MSITLIITIVTVIVSVYTFNQTDVLRKFMMNPYLIHNRGQYYRFITSGFIHADFIHLIFNMVSFYYMGSVVEAYFNVFFEYGKIYFIAFYLLSIIVSDIPSYFKQRTNPSYNALGASGGVSAVIFAAIIFQPVEEIFIYTIPIPGFILGILYLIWSYYQGKRGGDNINHDAHLYGALFGVLFCIIMHPASIKSFFEQIAAWNYFNQ